MKGVRRKVLVVDDEPVNIKIVMNILRDDYEILAAVSGVQALKVAKEQQPDIILLDMVMPEMNGIEVCQKLKKDSATRDIPVFFVTVMDDLSNEEVGLKAGAADYIAKPVQPDILKARLKIHIEYRLYAQFLEKLLAKRTFDVKSIQSEVKGLLEN